MKIRNAHVTEQTDSFNRLLMIKPLHHLKLTLAPLHDNVKPILTINGKNLFNGSFDNGYLEFGKKKLLKPDSLKYRTTKWFPILASQGKSLVLSGTAHNRSTWQFKTSDGSIITDVGLAQKYKKVSDVLHDKTVSKVDIPENAVYARVYYSCLDEEDTELDHRLQIEYGKIPTSYQPFEEMAFDLPELNKNDSLVFENGIWSHMTKHGNHTIHINNAVIFTGFQLSVSPDTCRLTYSWADDEKNIIHTGIYGVRFNTKDSNPICERIEDAKNLHFNCVIGNSNATPYQNDFDSIYPWSDIKVCNVKILKNGKRKITYWGEEGFLLNGLNGNVMVEIPKFYCKREIIDDYEYLWISATEQKDFTLDPSFNTETGTVDHIYIGTYLSRIRSGRLISISNSYPLIRKSMHKLRDLIKNSKGFTECDLLSILTLQRLFLVETAVLDSQSIFTGNVYLPYLLKDKSTSYYAVKSELATNRIIVKDTNMTRRFREGDAVSILKQWKDYMNKSDRFQRIITSIRAHGNQTLEIAFTGNPIDIEKGETGITCLPCRNGETDKLPYATGSIEGASGHTSFKYRGIENLWGNVFIILDNAYVKNSKLYLKYATGKTVEISYSLPVQKVQLSAQQFGDPSNMIIKKMGYDDNNPLIMFPSEIGHGASTHSYYCDAWYNLAKENVTYLITYGGAWDNKGYAGIFNFRASLTEKRAISYNGSRIMLR
ncbi:MAG: hypothetical protein K0S76_690 [Herbinix sp.]|nr:hypothetical protein [Herbinix sp.]